MHIRLVSRPLDVSKLRYASLLCVQFLLVLLIRAGIVALFVELAPLEDQRHVAMAIWRVFCATWLLMSYGRRMVRTSKHMVLLILHLFFGSLAFGFPFA